MASLELRPVGARAVLVEVADSATALSVAAFLRTARLAADLGVDLGVEPGVVEVVPGACTVLVDGVGDLDAVRARLESWRPETAPDPGELVELPVTYDGADLTDVAARWGTDVDGVVARHTATDFVSAFCGFAPGFAYLAGLPDEYAVARLDSPRPSVPAGSVGLAGPWCGVYPTASPGGWRLLGHTDVPLWNPAGDPPALLAPGTRVRFVAR